MTTFPANEKRLRHAREASHAPRTVIAIAVARLINSNSHLPASPDDKLCHEERREHDAASGLKKSKF